MSSESDSSRGYGPAQNAWVKNRLYFDGDQRKFELWHVKFMGYLKLRKLKDVVDPPAAVIPSVPDNTGGGDDDGGGDGSNGTNVSNTTQATPAATTDAEKNAEVYAELIQFLDDRSLSLVIRDAPDDGKKAINILREHYMGKGKPRVVTLWTELSTLVRGGSEDVTDYIIRAENAVAALRMAGEVVSDSLLIAMVLKGLPSCFKPFEVVVTQNHDVLTFSDFKIALRNYEDTENARLAREGDSVKHFVQHRKFGGNSNNNPRQGSNNNGGNTEKNDNGGAGAVVCFLCGGNGHKAFRCNKKGKKWCKNCKTGTHNTNSCRKSQNHNNNDHQNKSSANRMEGHSNNNMSSSLQ